MVRIDGGVRGHRSRLRAPRSPTGSGSGRTGELRVNVKEFRVRNQTKTSNERQAAADQVPPSLDQRSRPDPGAGRAARRPDHRGREIGSIRRLARERPSGLEADARELSRPQGGHRHSRAPRQPARSDRRARSRPCSATACSGPAPCRPTRNRAGCCRSARRASRGPPARLVPRDRVVPERIVKPEGPVYQEFCSAFTSPRVGQILFGLIANQLDSTPTLTYEAEATAQLREEARNRVPDHFDTYTPRRGPGRARTDDRRGAAHPASSRARRRLGRARFRRPGPARLGIFAPGRRLVFPGGILRMPARARGLSAIPAGSP